MNNEHDDLGSRNQSSGFEVSPGFEASADAVLKPQEAGASGAPERTSLEWAREALSLLHTQLGNMAFNLGQPSCALERESVVRSLSDMEHNARQGLALSTLRPAPNGTVPGRLADLGPFIEGLAEWDCLDPHDQADAIRRFLTDPLAGIEHLREPDLRVAASDGSEPPNVSTEQTLDRSSRAELNTSAAQSPTDELLEALRAADEALAQVTAFEEDARYIMGNTNFNIVKMRRAQVQTAIAKHEPKPDTQGAI